jgi:probable rRNA maturation factor
MVTITFSNQTDAQLAEADFLPTIISTLKNHGITDNVEVELRIVGNQAMRTLNRDHRHKDYATDVLSFPVWPNLDTIKARVSTEKILLGSIVICLPVAIRDAATENESLEEKLSFLTEHSLLHLMGFHHEGDE